MKKRSNSKGNGESYDFHFIVPKSFSIEKFVESAKKDDRPLTSQFRRIIEEYYNTAD